MFVRVVCIAFAFTLPFTIVSGENRSSESICEQELFPCSNTIYGNCLLIVGYGIVLGFCATLISEGAEGLLDVGLPATLVGGVVLPVLGAVPDAAMILVSGLGNIKQAHEQLSVGMGTLAGSTILLLTLAWSASLYVGRLDILVDSNGKKYTEDKRCNGFSLFKQGVEPSNEVLVIAVMMLVTIVPYLVIQNIIGLKDANLMALITLILSGTGFVLYLGWQIYAAHAGKSTLVRIHNIKHRRMLVHAATAFASAIPHKPLENEEDQDEEDKKKLNKMKSFGRAWKMHAHASRIEEGETSAPNEEKSSDADNETEEEEMPRWKIALLACTRLLLGVGGVIIFSDPMCDTLSSLTRDTNYSYVPIPAFYVSFIITPLCSNASEIVSSIIFAMKKQKENISLTFSQLYGAAVMNNTLCLAVFASLVYFRKLKWDYSAEVSVIVGCQVAVGLVALIFHKRYYFFLALPIACIYFASLVGVYSLETFLDWH